MSLTADKGGKGVVSSEGFGFINKCRLVAQQIMYIFETLLPPEQETATSAPSGLHFNRKEWN